MTDKSNLIDTIAKQDKFSTFARLMASSGTNEVIKSGQFTVFVPTNDAFSKIPEAKINDLLNEAGQAKLKHLLSYHILPGKVMAASLVSAPARKAVTGEELMFTDINGLKVNGASVQARNLEATNGVVHALDTLLTPTLAPRSVDTAAVQTPIAIAAGLRAANASASAAPAVTTAPDGSKVLSTAPVTRTAIPAGTDTKSVL